MSLIQAIGLGILQGLTEFLPVSSSGHLVLAKSVLHIQTGSDVSFEVFTHFGTLVSLLIVFRSDIFRILLAIGEAARQPSMIVSTYRQSPMLRYTWYVALGCIPAGVIGVLYHEPIEAVFADVKLVSDLLLITGFVLFLTRFAKPRPGNQVSWKSALSIGAAQAFAILPGISRTGITISTGVLTGVSQEESARFSFLMAFPVIFGAAALSLRQLILQPPSSLQLSVLAFGALASALAGYAALRLLLGILRKGNVSLFSYYCFAIGIVGLLFLE